VLFNVGAADEADSRTCNGAVLLTGDLRTLAWAAVAPSAVGLRGPNRPVVESHCVVNDS